MRIITLGRIGGIGEGDNAPYEGNGYLLRFSIQSEDEFFARQLPFIVDTLRIDIRQIMRLELLGDGYSGLRHVMICISFEDTEDESNGGRPEDSIEELWAAPKILASESGFNDDILRDRLIQFLFVAPAVVKARFLRDFARIKESKDVELQKLQHESYGAGFLYRVSFDAGSPPSIAEWRNTLIYCSEALRRNFQVERLERVAFTAIPNSEQDYRVEAELLHKSPRAYGDRSEPRFRPRIKMAPSPPQVVNFQIGRPEHKLTDAERRALAGFDELNTQERLRLWSLYLSKFFRQARAAGARRSRDS